MLVDCDCRGKFGRGRVGEIYHDLFSLGEIFFLSLNQVLYACTHASIPMSLQYITLNPLVNSIPTLALP